MEMPHQSYCFFLEGSSNNRKEWISNSYFWRQWTVRKEQVYTTNAYAIRRGDIYSDRHRKLKQTSKPKTKHNKSVHLNKLNEWTWTVFSKCCEQLHFFSEWLLGIKVAKLVHYKGQRSAQRLKDKRNRFVQPWHFSSTNAGSATFRSDHTGQTRRSVSWHWVPLK